MKKIAISLGVLSIVVLAFSFDVDGGRAASLKLDEGFGSAPLHFIANKGQAASEALYYASTPGYTLWLTQKGFLFDGTAAESKRAVSRLVFKNANEKAAVRAEDPSDYRVSYFNARDEADWITDVPTSLAVVYDDLYAGIDLKVYGNERRVEYDWIVRSGADPNRIRFAYEDVQQTRIDRNGDLVIETANGELRHRKPVSYQVIAGKRVEVSASFRTTADGSCGFQAGSYDSRFDLVIDPLVLVYSTYLGGGKKDISSCLAVDGEGAIYIAGTTLSTDFPPLKASLPRTDVFVSKLSSDGKSLIYSAFFPTASSYPSFPALAVDSSGHAFLAMTTSTTKFPIKNAFQPQPGGKMDGVILKMNANGKGLAYSSYIGGSSSDSSNGVVLDKEDQAYVVGTTSSPNFPLKKAFQKKLAGYNDLFILKVAADGKSLLFSTLLGGSSSENAGMAHAIDDSGALYIVGQTYSPDFPTKNAFQPVHGGGADAFIAKISPEGKNLEYSTFLGGNGDDRGNGIAVDAGGAIYVTGYSAGGFPVKNAFQKTRKGGGDVFVTKLTSDGTGLVFSTYLGGSGWDQGYSIALDAADSIYIAGYTQSPNFPVKDAYQSRRVGSEDAFLTILDSSGKKLLTSTYLGGIYKETAYQAIPESDGTIYLTGITNSPDFQTVKAYQSALKGDFDAFIVKFKRK